MRVRSLLVVSVEPLAGAKTCDISCELIWLDDDVTTFLFFNPLEGCLTNEGGCRLLVDLEEAVF